MKKLKAIETIYKGYRFRSRLEARWAVFFDTLGIEWEYEPEGYILNDGTHYLPDFLLHNFEGRIKGDLYVEVKGKATIDDFNKIMGFSGYDPENNPIVANPILVLGAIPNGSTIDEINRSIEDIAYEGIHLDNNKILYPFNFITIDGDYFACHIGVNKKGKPKLFGDDSSYLFERDSKKTLHAYLKAKQARFEFAKNNERGGGSE